MKKIKADIIKILMFKKLTSIGVDCEHAEIISKLLTETSMDGTDTHGIRLFPFYLKELQCGRAKLIPHMSLENESPVSALFNADDANGIVAGYSAMNKAIEKAESIGIGLVLAKNSNHFGAAVNYTLLAAKKGLIGLCMSNSDALVSLEGGTKAFGCRSLRSTKI